ncbi:MAG: CPBP family intramembrane metalloprotease [Clostridia bacterium]|nr:CPBP family intramembrane metalloprotease [Clostridia bacterium]
MEQSVNTPAVPDKPALMKRAYNRAGISMLVQYQSLQMIGSIFVVIAAVIVSFVLIVPQLQGDVRLSMDSIMTLLRETGGIRWILLVYVLGMIVGMTVGLLIIRKILTERVPLEKKSLSLGQFLVVALMTYGLWGIGVLIGNLPMFFGVTESNGMDELLNGLKTEAIPMYLYMVIGAPIFEELACRKFLLDRLHPYGEGFAMLVSALLFGLIHGNSGQFFLAFFIGLLFAMVYMRTGRIVYTMLLHGMINLTATLPEFFALADIDILLGWNIAVISLGVIGVIVLLLRKKAHDPLLSPTVSDFAGATNATWRNPGMIIMRVFGLVTLVTTDLLMLAMSLLNEQSAWALLRLPISALTLVTVLLLPKFSKRFEQPAEVQQNESESLIP